MSRSGRLPIVGAARLPISTAGDFMSYRASRLRPGSLVALVAFASLLSCGRDMTGPGGRGRQVELAFNPVFPQVRLAGNGEVLSISDVVDFARVRVVLVRTNGDTAVDRMVDFPSDSTSIRLTISVTLSEAATSEGEPFQATLKYISSTGDTVFTGGPVSVVAKVTGSGQTPPDIPVTYTGLGANAASITISPTGLTGVTGQNIPFTAQVFDAQANLLAGAPVAFTSTDSGLVHVNLRTGVGQVIGVRGTANIIAQTLTGQADTATVTVPPVPTAIVLVSGGNQSVRQGSPFAQPVTVRVNAADGLPVSGVPVDFAVTRGQGSAAPTADTTDANGLAQTSWTSGDSAGVGNLTATIAGTGTFVVVPGNQLSSAPTAITFETQPTAIVAGVALPAINVVVRDATGDTVRTYNGSVDLVLTSGTAGANLLGERPIAAANGVISFTGLTVDRAGTSYRLSASVPVGPTALSDPFNVTAAPPSAVLLFSGGGQTAPASTALADSIVARVVDQFGFAKSGVTVNWAVTLGGGAVSPASAVTDANGRAATRWTIGAGGTQQVSATVGALTPLLVGASVFQAGGQPTLFSGVDFVELTVLGSRTIPIYLEPAAAAPIVATLEMRDTSIAAWSAPTVTFTAGSTLRSPSISGVAVGNTWAIITSSAGIDSLEVHVAQASVNLSGNQNHFAIRGDTLWKFVRLSAPAPVGGVTVRVVSTDTSVVLVAPASGRGTPSDECDDFYCSDLRAPAGESILAPPSDTALVTIPAGQTHGQVVLLTVGVGSVDIDVSAPSFAGAARQVTVSAPTFYLYTNPNAVYPVGVGYTIWVEVDIPTEMSRAVPLRITSRDTSIIAVQDSAPVIAPFQNYVYDMRMKAVGAGTTWLVVESPGFAPESVTYTIVPPVMYMYDRSPLLGIGSRHRLGVTSATDANGTYAGYWSANAPIAIAASSSDTSVFGVDFGGQIDSYSSSGDVLVHAVGAGTAWLRASAPGHATDSVLVTVSSSLIDVTDYDFHVGVGQIHQSMQVTPYLSYADNTGQLITIDVTSSDPAIATVLTPRLVAPAGDYGPSPRILGLAAGTVTLTFSGVGIDTVTRSFDVTPPELRWGGLGQSGGTYNADSANYALYSYTADDLSYQRPVAAAMSGILRSTDPAVVSVTDSVMTFAAGASTSQGGLVRMIGPGTAQLVVTMPGFAPETTAVITLRPYRIEISPTFVYQGRGLLQSVGFGRRSLTGAPLPLTVTVSGPAGVSVAEPLDTIPAGSFNGVLQLRTGTGLGTDTVIVSAPGHAPDTLHVVVTASIVTPAMQTYGEVGAEFDVGAAFRSSTDYLQRAVRDSITVRISVSDTSVLEVLTDSIRIAAGSSTAFLTGAVRLARPGSAWLRTTDASGLFGTDSVQVYVDRRHLYPSRDRLDIGMNQATYPGELYLYRDYSTADSVWVHFTSSAPNVAHVLEDSVLVSQYGSYAYFNITAGDSVGGVIITGHAAGYVDFDIPVGVSRGKVEFYTDNSIVSGRTSDVEVYLTSPLSYETRYTTVDIPFRMSSLDTSIARIGPDSLFTIPAGDGWINTGVGPVIGGRAGRTSVLVEDIRSGVFQRASTAYLDVAVDAAELQTGVAAYALAVGLRFDYGYVYTNTYDSAGIWVQLNSVRGRVAFADDSVYVSGYGGGTNFSMTGLSAGTDTVVLSAPGFAPDTVIAVVGPGLIALGQTPALLVVGDSLRVTGTLQTSSGDQAFVAGAALTLTFAATGPLSVTEQGGTVPITALPVTTGFSAFQFWVKATGAGGGFLDITAPGMNPVRFHVVTTNAP